MAMVRLTFFVRDDVLERYDALVYRSGVNRSHLLREALDVGLPGVRAALPGLRARYGEGRTVRRPRAMDPVDAAERADAARLRLERPARARGSHAAASAAGYRLGGPARGARRIVRAERARAGTGRAARPGRRSRARRFGFLRRAWFRPACALEVTDASSRGSAAACAGVGRTIVDPHWEPVAEEGALHGDAAAHARSARLGAARVAGVAASHGSASRAAPRWREHGPRAVTWWSTSRDSSTPSRRAADGVPVSVSAIGTRSTSGIVRGGRYPISGCTSPGAALRSCSRAGDLGRSAIGARRWLVAVAASIVVPTRWDGAAARISEPAASPRARCRGCGTSNTRES